MFRSHDWAWWSLIGTGILMFLMEAPNWSLFVFDHYQPSILRVDPGIVSNGLDVIASILARWVHFCHLMFPVVYTLLHIFIFGMMIQKIWCVYFPAASFSPFKSCQRLDKPKNRLRWEETKKTDWCLVGNGMGLLLIVIMDHSRKFPAFSTGTNTWDTIDTTLFMWKLQISGLLGHTLLSRPAGSRVQEQMNFKSLGKTILSQMISQGQTTFLSSIYF